MTSSAEKDERFRYLYGKYYRSVIGFLVRFGFIRDEARDLAQDVFVRLYEHMKEYRGEAEWRFLEVTARNLALNRVRERGALKRRGATVALEEIAETAGPAPALDVELAARQEAARLHERLHGAIAELPEGTRNCLLLRLQDCSYIEIQGILGITMDAVKSRLRDARLRLKALLAAEPEGIAWPNDDDS